MSKITVPVFKAKKDRGEKIVMLTAYDVTFARLLDKAGVDGILVGDSLGMVIQGNHNTLSVTVEDIIYHTKAVVRGVKRAHVVADMPFMSYQLSPEKALENAGRIIKESGAEAVKMEGGEEIVETVYKVVQAGIPVMGHIGLRPQMIHYLGGYKVQGKSASSRERLIKEAKLLEEAGVYAIVLEGITMEVAKEITEALSVPTIGIGAGPWCDGQILVVYDLLGMDDSFSPRFLKKYVELSSIIFNAVKNYCEEVRKGLFPDYEHSFSINDENMKGKEEKITSILGAK